MTKDEALKLELVIAELRQAHAGHTNEGPSTFSDAADLLEALAQPEQEPLEYWNAVEGWVKIEEVRQHFETVSCGTIYKTGGEGRVPLYTTPPNREWVRLTDEDMEWCYDKQRQTYNRHKMSVRGQMVTEADDPTMHLVWAVEAKLKELNHD